MVLYDLLNRIILFTWGVFRWIQVSNVLGVFFVENEFFFMLGLILMTVDRWRKQSIAALGGDSSGEHFKDERHSNLCSNRKPNNDFIDIAIKQSIVIVCNFCIFTCIFSPYKKEGSQNLARDTNIWKQGSLWDTSQKSCQGLAVSW